MMHRWPFRHVYQRAPFYLTTSATGIWLQNSTPRSHCEGLRDASSRSAAHLSFQDSQDAGSLNSSGSQDKENTASPPTDETEDISSFADDDEVAWANFSARFAEAKSSLATIPWSSIGDTITDHVIPEWAQALPSYIAKLQKEMQMSEGSLAEEIWQEAQDPQVYPEITQTAKVRIGNELCPDEIKFIQQRKKRTTNALAKYLDISEADIDPSDVPTIAVCGSGGGLRALVAGASSYFSAQEAGLLDCATYTAGVSGSCWLQALYHSSIGNHDYSKLIRHLKKRIGVHIAYPPAFLELMTKTPTNKYLLSGTIEKLKGDPKADFGLVDIYGLLLGTRLLVPSDELGVHQDDLKLSNQRMYLDEGAYPLPIYTAVRHEIPIEEEKAKGKSPQKAKRKAKERAWFQWFEFSPYEMWSETFGAGIPAWGVGRHYENGRTKVRDNGLGLPELRIPFMMGMWGSAFCATLAHYYKEIRPVVKGLAGFGGVDGLISEKDDALSKLHPIDPGTIPNYLLGLQHLLPKTIPQSVFKDKYLELMDAGMSNNLPIYPLIRPARNVDIIVCFDASADIKEENWISVVDHYAQQHRIKAWPMGTGWPNRSKEHDQVAKRIGAADAVTAQLADEPTTDVKERQTEDRDVDQARLPQDEKAEALDLGYCNIWVGTDSPNPSVGHRIHFNHSSSPKSPPPPSSSSSSASSQSTTTHSSLVASAPKANSSPSPSALSRPDAGITLIYFPLIPNPEKAPGIDPDTSPYLSTWNFIYTPEQIDSVVRLARANFAEGEDATKQAVRAVFERKKAARLRREKTKMETESGTTAERFEGVERAEGASNGSRRDREKIDDLSEKVKKSWI